MWRFVTVMLQEMSGLAIAAVMRGTEVVLSDISEVLMSTTVFQQEMLKPQTKENGLGSQ